MIAGVGALSTAAAIDLAQDTERLGADAVMLVPPFYDPLDFATLTTFLRAVAESISLPIVYYNVPGATGIRLNADQIAELGEIEGVDYLKDTSGDAVTLTDLLVNRTDKIKAFNGWDTLTFLGIASGAEASVWGPPALSRSWPFDSGTRWPSKATWLMPGNSGATSGRSATSWSRSTTSRASRPVWSSSVTRPGRPACRSNRCPVSSAPPSRRSWSGRAYRSSGPEHPIENADECRNEHRASGSEGPDPAWTTKRGTAVCGDQRSC